MKCGYKVCFVSGVISRSGGTERVGSIIANSLSERGYDVFVLSFWNHGQPYYHLGQNVHLHYLLNPRKEGKLYRTYIYPILKLHHFIKKYSIDIIIDIDTELSVYTSYAIRGTKCKLISWEHFNYWTMEKLKEKRRFRAKELIKKYASNLVVLTEEDRIKHREIYNLSEDFVTVIPNPCLSEVSVRYCFSNHVFLSVGRLVEEKGYDMLLRAWEIAQNDIPEWKLVIVGEGKLKRKLINLKEDMELEHVVFAGHSDNVEEYYSQASCYVLSSRYEGFPMVILEAQSYGLPVISFNCKTGPQDLVEQGVNGYLIEDGNVQQMAECMVAFTKSPEKAEKMSVFTTNKVKDYNLDSIVKKWDQLLKEISGNSRA